MLPYPLFTILGQPIYAYGLFIAVGIICCLIVLFVYTKKEHISQQVQDFSFYVGIVAIALGFLFAKLFQAFYEWYGNGFRHFDFEHAGITVMGGLIGGAGVFILLYFLVGKIVFKNSKVEYKKEFNKIVRVAPCCITIAHAFGRLGCLSAPCCYGRFLGTEYVPGGIRMLVNGSWGYYVPAQLYEALFLFALFIVLSILYFKKSNILLQIYLISYAVWRFVLEFFRADDSGRPPLLGLTPSQWMSILFVIIAFVMFIIYAKKKIPFTLKEDKNKTE